MKHLDIAGYKGPRLPREVQLCRLKKVIEQELTQNQREMVEAYFFEELTMKEIAQRRGIAISTVSRTLDRALRRIYRCLKY